MDTVKHQRMNQSSEGASFMACCLLWISLRESFKYIVCQVCFIVCCFSSLIRLSKYRSSHCTIADGMNFPVA